MKNLLEWITIDINNPTDTLIKTSTYLGIGTGLEHMEWSLIPSIIMEIAKFLAYLGASTAFFKWLGGLLSRKNSNNKEE